ncbi:MAG TPA: DivIVA domain-containing protein [Solirubrobacteraceae bacterium]|nr:DivIVA domain-containing protein [Solirubrobacteraceae bacterium]
MPEDPLAIVNADFPTALRGYDRMAVENYVRQTRQLVAELQATRSPEAAVRRALERVGEQISGILQRAHETAEQITAQSRSEAEDRLEQARLEAAQIAGAAEQRVRDLDADTDRIWLERQRIVADAEDLAAQLTGLARTAAERFPADADADADADSDPDPDPAPAPDAGPEPYDEEPEQYDEGEDEPEDAGEVEAGPTDEGEDQPEDAAAEVDHRSEVERTVAFQPLEADEVPPAAGQGSTDDDDTAVIPPASQAANRRANK